tara:strand:+ start:190 stop:417 length:228 start_codon:yes stop_codon:yes gene_type:complete
MERGKVIICLYMVKNSDNGVGSSGAAETPSGGRRVEKEARLSAALRDNLRRRKAAQRKSAADSDRSAGNSNIAED